jgi:hypothetical protein
MERERLHFFLRLGRSPHAPPGPPPPSPHPSILLIPQKKSKNPDTHSVTWFANRPARHTGVLDTQLWSATKASVAKAEAEAAAAVAAAVKEGKPPPTPVPDPAATLTAADARAAKAAPFSEVWATQPPNAAAVGLWGPDAKPRVVVVVLRDPVYSAASASLTFSIEVLANHTAWPADEAPSLKGPDNTADADALAVAEASGGGGGLAKAGKAGGGLAADAAAAAERRRAAGGVARVVELGPDGEVRTKEEAVARDADGRQIPVATLREAAAAAVAAKAAPASPAPPKRAPVDLAECVFFRFFFLFFSILCTLSAQIDTHAPFSPPLYLQINTQVHPGRAGRAQGPRGRAATHARARRPGPAVHRQLGRRHAGPRLGSRLVDGRVLPAAGLPVHRRVRRVPDVRRVGRRAHRVRWMGEVRGRETVCVCVTLVFFARPALTASHSRAIRARACVPSVRCVLARVVCVCLSCPCPHHH